MTYRVTKDYMIDKDEVTGEEVKNRFTGDDAYEGMPIDGSSVDQNIEFVHRNNFPELLTECEHGITLLKTTGAIQFQNKHQHGIVVVQRNSLMKTVNLPKLV